MDLVAAISSGQRIRDEDVARLEEVLVEEMLSDYSEEHGLTDRGRDVDDLIGVCAQYAESFHAS